MRFLYKRVDAFEKASKMHSAFCHCQEHYLCAVFHEDEKLRLEKLLCASNDMNVQNDLMLRIEQDKLLIEKSKQNLCRGFFSQYKHVVTRKDNEDTWFGAHLQLELSTSEDIARARYARVNAEAVKMMMDENAFGKRSKRTMSMTAQDTKIDRVNKHKIFATKKLF
jgi:hypothetical protein